MLDGRSIALALIAIERHDPFSRVVKGRSQAGDAKCITHRPIRSISGALPRKKNLFTEFQIWGPGPNMHPSPSARGQIAS